MEIYDYLNSPDIADHCRDIDHAFNMLEAAAIVAKSHYALEVKLEGWQKILVDYEDMDASSASPQYTGKGCISDLISHHIQNRLSEVEAWHDEKGALYCVDHKSGPGKIGFQHLGEALAYVRQNNNGRKCVEVEKHLSGSVSWFATYNLNGTLLELMGDFKNIWGKLNRLFFSQASIYVPTPFAFGDILQIVLPMRGFWHKSGPFILEKMPFDNKEQHQRQSHQRSGNNKCCSIWRVTENGTIESESTGNYLSFRYYSGDLGGELRTLKFIQQFIRGKMTLGELIYMQNQVLLQEIMGLNLNTKQYSDSSEWGI